MKYLVFLIVFIPTIIFGQDNAAADSKKLNQTQQDSTEKNMETNSFSNDNQSYTKSQLDSIHQVETKQKLETIQKVRVSDVNSALKLCKELYHLADSLRLENVKAETLNEEGLCYLSLHVFDESFKKFMEAKSIFEKNQDTSNYVKVITNLGKLQAQNGDYDAALEFFISANIILTEGKNDIDLAYNQLEIAELFLAKGDYARALDFYLVSQIVWENEKMLVQQADAKTGIGKVFRKTGKDSEAHKYFMEAEKIYSENNAELNLAKLNNEIAQYLFDVKKDAEEALKRLKKSEKLLLDNQLWKDYLTNSKLQQNILKSMNRFEEALAYSEKAENVQETKFDEKKNQVLAELQMRYKTKELENENINLRIQLKKNHEKKEICHKITFGIVAILIIIWIAVNYRRKKARK